MPIGAVRTLAATAAVMVPLMCMAVMLQTAKPPPRRIRQYQVNSGCALGEGGGGGYLKLSRVLLVNRSRGWFNYNVKISSGVLGLANSLVSFSNNKYFYRGYRFEDAKHECDLRTHSEAHPPILSDLQAASLLTIKLTGSHERLFKLNLPLLVASLSLVCRKIRWHR